CMAFGKAIFTETFDLGEAPLGKFLRISVALHALHELVSELVNRTGPPECRHRSTQFVGLGRCEAGALDGDTHRLFLEEGYPESPLQNLLQLAGILGFLFSHSPAKIGMDHVALN